MPKRVCVSATLIVLVMLCTSPGARAHAYEDALLSGGLLVDNTYTHKGQTFFQNFSMAWHQINPKISGSISITEQPNARSGHKVFVTFDRHIVYVGIIRSGNFNLEQQGKQAAQQSSQRIQSLIVQQVANHGEDLASDEI